MARTSRVVEGILSILAFLQVLFVASLLFGALVGSVLLRPESYFQLMGFVFLLACFTLFLTMRWQKMLREEKSERNIKRAAGLVAVFAAHVAASLLQWAPGLPEMWETTIPFFFATWVGIAVYAWLASRMLREEGFDVAGPLSLVGGKLMLLVSAEIYIMVRDLVGTLQADYAGLSVKSDNAFAIVPAAAFYMAAMHVLRKRSPASVDNQAPHEQAPAGEDVARDTEVPKHEEPPLHRPEPEESRLAAAVGWATVLLGCVAAGVLLAPLIRGAADRGREEWVRFTFVLLVGAASLPGLFSAWCGMRLVQERTAATIRRAAGCLAVLAVFCFVLTVHTVLPDPPGGAWTVNLAIMVATVGAMAFYAWLADLLMRKEGIETAGPLSLVSRHMVFLLSLEVWVIVIALLPALIPERIFGPDGSFFLGAFASMVGAAFLAWAFYKTTLKWLRIGPGEYPNPPPPGEALPQDGPG